MAHRAASVLALMCGVALSGGCAGKTCGPCTTAADKPCTTVADAGNWKHFGESMKLTGRDTMCAAGVLAEKERYNGKFVRVEGTVDSVCAARGCWLRLGCPRMEETLFVKFTCPVEGRLIPMGAIGHAAVIEGTLEVTEISEEEAHHYKEDAGASADEIARVVGSQKVIRMKSPAAMIQGV